MIMKFAEIEPDQIESGPLQTLLFENVLGTKSLPSGKEGKNCHFFRKTPENSSKNGSFVINSIHLNVGIGTAGTAAIFSAFF